MIIQTMESDSDNENTSEIEDTAGLSNPGWADSVAKILHSNKPKGKKTLVLSKAKKLTDLRKEKVKPAGFQVATEEGEIQDVKVEEEVAPTEPPAKKVKKELPTCRVKPNILDKDRERTLSKIATRGVVQLFNAVRLQQKDISNKLKEAGPLEVRKEKVLKNIDKRAFLDVLMGEKSISETVPEHEGSSVRASSESNGKDSKTAWSVLRDDFMMEAKLKDWDKELEESENEGENEVEHEIESD